MPGFIAPLELDEKLLWPEELELLARPELEDVDELKEPEEELEDELLADGSVAPQPANNKLQAIISGPQAN